MKQNEIEHIEVELLLEAVYQRYGYDFRSYARASIDRRVRQFVAGRGVSVISELIPRVLYNEALFSELAQYFSIAVTEMFRDPFVYRAVRAQVVPLLRTYPFVKVWHAGCATGEEVYSMAILLAEEGLDKRVTIFGTDFNDDALARAREGIYPADRIKEYTRNYQEAGGTRSFSEYYHAQYESAALNSGLKKHVTFANHNLASDAAFGEMHLVFCRNVLIYFNRELQNRALGVIDDSLTRGGFLCLGTKEDLRFTAVADRYEVVDAGARIYKKKARE
jgi:chemotaxis protein methyltransferase CheR